MDVQLTHFLICFVFIGCATAKNADSGDLAEGPMSEVTTGAGGTDGGSASSSGGTSAGEDTSTGADGTEGSGGEEGAGEEGAGDEGGGGDGAEDDTGEEWALEGFIGSPCESDEDCDFDDGVCLIDGFSGGHCSAPCDRFCPDREGHPVTFCVDAASLPDETLSGGWCVSRCSFGFYPASGCREDYGCRIESRFGETSTETYTCVPGESSDLSSCQVDLAARGIGFEPTIRGIDHPEGRPDKVCEIIDPVWVETPLLGVDLRYVEFDEPSRVLAGCEMAHALADTVEDVTPYGVSELIHIGTYNCRMIDDSESLSEHSFANAIDIYGFQFDDGTTWTLIGDWEHDTDAPISDGGVFLYEAAQRWHEEWIWNVILTPNYNLDHDNHFHVDLKPGFHDLLIPGDRYYGPAPYRD